MVNQEHIDWADIVNKLSIQKEEAIAKLHIVLSHASDCDCYCNNDVYEGINEAIQILKRYMK
jgi:hypothetical protein